MKFIRNTGITLIVLILLYLLLRQFNLIPHIGNWFTSKPVTIENTPLIIEKIKDLNELITITSYDEVVIVRNTNQEGTLLGNIFQNGPINPSPKKIGLITKGTLHCGIDLKEIKEKDITIKKDSIALSIPQAKIIDAIINPSDTEIFIEEGKWELHEINKLKAEARDMLIEKAKDKKVLEKANDRARLVLENFLLRIGFKKVSITSIKTVN